MQSKGVNTLLKDITVHLLKYSSRNVRYSSFSITPSFNSNNFVDASQIQFRYYSSKLNNALNESEKSDNTKAQKDNKQEISDESDHSK